MRRKHSHRHVASKGRYTIQMINAALFVRFALNSTGSGDTVPRIHCERNGDVTYRSEYATERARILYCLSSALCEERDHRMSRVTDQRRAPNRKRGNGWPAIDWPDSPLHRCRDKRARFADHPANPRSSVDRSPAPSQSCSAVLTRRADLIVATKLTIDPPRKGYWTRCASGPRRRIISLRAHRGSVSSPRTIAR